MTPDELRAAAELVVEQVTMYGRERVAMAWELKAKSVAEAWLAEHPADDADQITAERLLSAGGVEGGYYGIKFVVPGVPSGHLLIGEPDEDETGWTVHYSAFGLPSSQMPDVTTWGQLRRLCAAIGITLKPAE